MYKVHHWSAGMWSDFHYTTKEDAVERFNKCLQTELDSERLYDIKLIDLETNKVLKRFVQEA